MGALFDSKISISSENVRFWQAYTIEASYSFEIEKLI